jgi:hypothetical protein
MSPFPTSKSNTFSHVELENAQPLGGTTRTKEAMLHARREFEHKFGGRDKADRVMIVFTDGYSQDDPAEIAPELRRERIHVYAVAVEDKEVAPNGDQLKAIASDPQVNVILIVILREGR